MNLNRRMDNYTKIKQIIIYEGERKRKRNEIKLCFVGIKGDLGRLVHIQTYYEATQIYLIANTFSTFIEFSNVELGKIYF